MMETEEAAQSTTWSLLREDVGVVIWASFLITCFETMVFFAYFDPILLGPDTLAPAWLTNRTSGYGVGFFFFWFFNLAAAGLTAYLFDSGPHAAEHHEHITKT